MGHVVLSQTLTPADRLADLLVSARCFRVEGREGGTRVVYTRIAGGSPFLGSQVGVIRQPNRPSADLIEHRVASLVVKEWRLRERQRRARFTQSEAT